MPQVTPFILGAVYFPIESYSVYKGNYIFKYLDSKYTFKGYFIFSNFLYIATAEKIFW